MDTISPLTDAEVLCSFMEPNPKARTCHLGVTPYEESPDKWWTFRFGKDRQPRTLTLNECQLIQSRLTDEQKGHYCGELAAIKRDLFVHTWYAIHVDAETRVKALAAVIRPLVEGR